MTITPIKPSATVSEQRVMRKVVTHVVPLLALSFFISIIDRTNIGFAALRMNHDLGIGPEVYGMAAGIFYAGYTLAEVPSNVLLLRFGAPGWFARIMASWGLLSMAMCLAHGSTSLFVLRFLLGLAEAGLFPGMIYYLSQWVPPAYTGRILSMLFIFNPISSAIGAPLSAWMLESYGWRAMFVIEGLPALLAAVLVWRYLPVSPLRVAWLNEAERGWLIARLRAPLHVHGTPVPWRAAVDRTTVFATIQLFLLLSGSYGVQLWLPQIVRDLNVPKPMTGWVVAIPFALAAIAMALHGRSSDRRGERFWHLVVPCLMAGAVFALGLFTRSPLAALTLLSLGTAAIFCSVQAFFAFPRSSAGPADAIILAGINALGNLGGFFGPTLLGVIKQRSGGLTGTMLAISLILFMAAGATMLRRPKSGAMRA